MPNLGLIVVDESHDDSYKETFNSPRYHARTASIAYAELAGAQCILGSATPDVVSTYQADHGAMIPLDLPNRIFGHTQRLERQAKRLGLKSRYKQVGRRRIIDPAPPGESCRHAARTARPATPRCSAARWSGP